MWILPKQLHTLASVQDTEALNLDLEESSRLCAQSLFVRSKHSRSQIWLQKWKRDSWTQHLYGRILKPSHTKNFVTEWTSLLEVIPVNHSAQQGSVEGKTTQDTSGLGSQMELGFSDPECASSRMSKDTSALDSAKSSENWKKLVTKCRGEYSLRVKLAHPTSGSGYSSWPTSNARDWKGPQGRAYKGISADLPSMVEMSGHPAPANHSTHGSHQESWATPQASDHIEVRRTDLDSNQKCLGRDMKQFVPPSAAKLNPRWVETLIGIPIGWTMPSCTRPVTIVQTNCACLETESCQQPQNEHLELF